MHVRVENQADDRHADDGQQNTARNLQFFKADDHRQAHQRHHHREAVELTQRDRQTVQRVFHHHADAVGGNQQQEQTDTDAGAVRNTLRQIAQDPATNTGSGDDGEEYAHQEHRAQSNRHADVLAQHQAESGKGSQRDGAANG